MACYTIGLDLGQAQDFTALAVVERVLTTPVGVSSDDYSRAVERVAISTSPLQLQEAQRRVPSLIEEWHVVHLQRWTIGTPYPVIVDDVSDLMSREPLASDGLLFIDGTGVGVAVTDLFYEKRRRHELGGCHPPVSVTITGGEKGHGWNIPKNDLFAALQLPLQQGRLKIPERLPLADVLVEELQGFRQQISDAGRTRISIGRREGKGHGDLAMALCLAMVHPNTARRPRTISREKVSA